MKSKSRSESPQTSPPVVKGSWYRVDSREGATTAAASESRQSSLRAVEAATTTMHGYQPYGTPSSDRDSSPRPGLLGPVQSGLRKASADSTPSRIVSNGYNSSPSNPLLSSPTENESGAIPWSSAIGHATTAGKSGRVIERLMAENDKLKRELELSMLRAQELEKNLATHRPQIDALRQENENLSHTSTVDSGLLARRERKIEELKAENMVKTERANRAESLSRAASRQIEEERELHARATQAMLEETKHATVHAEILETSHRQLAAEYHARRETWEQDLFTLQEGREADRQRIARLDVVCEQMRQEHERGQKVQAEMATRWEEVEEQLRGTLDVGEEVNERARKKSVEMERVVKQMRWVMAMKNNARRTDSVSVSREGSVEPT